jgi:hypothetical protein
VLSAAFGLGAYSGESRSVHEQERASLKFEEHDERNRDGRVVRDAEAVQIVADGPHSSWAWAARFVCGSRWMTSPSV